MGDKPIWEQIGSSFIQHYYQLFDNDRTQLGAIYIDASCLTWEGQQFQGKAAIVEKLSSLPFQKIQHSITAQDHQPTPDSCIISMVVGQLKVTVLLQYQGRVSRQRRALSPFLPCRRDLFIKGYPDKVTV
ncbi:nuclear transport factor 2 isoform X1 [Carlito syrichta]|uniref:Nuclear transport factor 2 n=1 Tax=Carlito syrichta TaxID=1868482 RepID=A0A3Q0EAW0_CARSF|nr:nuclear transport factor 2 isoform X1 [Carlito syrichta]XP_021572053.1 nuclear transport factor 2 isoform X1 [Carlito syrichta]